MRDLAVEKNCIKLNLSIGEFTRKQLREQRCRVMDSKSKWPSENCSLESTLSKAKEDSLESALSKVENRSRLQWVQDWL